MSKNNKRELIGMAVPFVGHCVLSDLEYLSKLADLRDRYTVALCHALGNPSWSVLLYRMSLFSPDPPHDDLVSSYQGAAYLDSSLNRTRAYSLVLPGVEGFMRTVDERLNDNFSPCMASFILTAFRDTAPLR